VGQDESAQIFANLCVLKMRRFAFAVDCDTFLVSPLGMKTITSRTLHEQTRHCLDRVKGGEKLQIVRSGKLSALLVPPESEADPDWPEIMHEVWEAQEENQAPRPNPVLRERARRKYAARVR
jgi:antitoxin (DNA-binding transcriptional repressor) of toxin-antitoxin stability system